MFGLIALIFITKTFLRKKGKKGQKKVEQLNYKAFKMNSIIQIERNVG